MRNMPRSGSPRSGSPPAANAAETDLISARNGAATSLSYTGLRGLSQFGSLCRASPRKKVKAAGEKPVKAALPVAMIGLWQLQEDVIRGLDPRISEMPTDQVRGLKAHGSSAAMTN